MFYFSFVIDRGNADNSITTDASLEGWWAVETFDRNIKANGRWNQEEKVYHINYLELLAILCALKALYQLDYISQEYVQQIAKYSYHNTNSKYL
jgi:hypothetical protein